MQKNYLLAGASSAGAQALSRMLQAEGHHFIGMSTKNLSGLGYSEHYQVADYSKSSLPTLPVHLDGLVYFPGTINLKPFRRSINPSGIKRYSSGDFRHSAKQNLSYVGC